MPNHPHPRAFQPQAPRLTLITDTTRLSSEAFFNAVEQALDGGVDAVLVREKKLTSAKLLALSSRLRHITREHQARLIIHTQADVAAAVDADGVHLASKDIDSINALRQWLGKAKISISVSCHNADELQHAHSMGADYAMLSPVFPTRSHPGAAPLGLDIFRTLADASPLPIIALGGISLQNCEALEGHRLAVISAILQADKPKQAARQLSQASSPNKGRKGETS